MSQWIFNYLATNQNKNEYFKQYTFHDLFAFLDFSMNTKNCQESSSSPTEVVLKLKNEDLT